MQLLTAAPRAALTYDQVLSLLTSSAATWDAGAELVDANLRVSQDISPALSAASTKRTMAAEIHGTCSFTTRQELAWGATLLRLYTTVSDRPVAPTLTARFNAGVYALVTPQRNTGVKPLTWDVTGFDRLYLLKRQIGDSYAVEAGTSYLDAVRSAVTASGISATTVLLDGSAQAKVLPQAMAWPLVRSNETTTYASTGDLLSEDSTDISSGSDSGPTTWLSVINDLLAAIGYRGLWADESGYFRSEPYLNPAQRASEWTFTVGNIAREVHAALEASLTRDEWGLPNKWVFVRRQSDTAPAEGNGIYTVTDAEGISRRGLIWPVQVDLDAVDQASLVTQGDARVAADKRIATTISRQLRPFPAMGHADVVTLVDVDLGGTFKVQASSWEQDLFGGNSSVEWRVIA